MRYAGRSRQLQEIQTQITMNKNLKRILIISLIGLSIFLINDWQKKKIEFQRENSLNGWYKYSNGSIEFEYPKKLRNCYECGLMRTGNIFTTMTDEEYVIMTMSNQNSSYLINPQRKFKNPLNQKLKTVRMKMDSIAQKNNLNPTDSFIVENLKINEIQLNIDSNRMNFDLSLLNESFSQELTFTEFNDCNSEPWNYWKLKKEENNDIKKFAYNLESGRFFLKRGSKEIFFELQKIKRTNLYNSTKHELDEKEIERFFNSIKMKK